MLHPQTPNRYIQTPNEPPKIIREVRIGRPPALELPPPLNLEQMGMFEDPRVGIFGDPPRIIRKYTH
jgi:hypothetical protein